MASSPSLRSLRARVVLLLLTGCKPTPDPVRPSAPVAAAQSGPVAEAGRALVARFECNRCHDGTGLPPAPRDKHCVRCHRDILEGRFASPLMMLARARGQIVSLRQVPSLAATGRRLRRDWVRAFLVEPHDLRPSLLATMPRLAMTPAEADALAAYLVPSESAAVAPLSPSLIPRGEQLYRRLRCGDCHRMNGASVDRAGLAATTITDSQREPPGDAQALAPDLAVTRERFQTGVLVDWLMDPQRLDPEALMPKFPLARDDAEALAAFVLETPLVAPAPRSLPPRLPLLSRHVAFAEVRDRVLHKTCWHCHAAPDAERGDGGPGNTGGFGFAQRRLDLSSLASVRRGSLDDAGNPRDLFSPLLDGTPRLVAHLLARQAEEAGAPVAGVRGMPLALPALTSEELQLVESWVAQGHGE